jgi:hypothetical protein
LFLYFCNTSISKSLYGNPGIGISKGGFSEGGVIGFGDEGDIGFGDEGDIGFGDEGDIGFGDEGDIGFGDEGDIGFGVTGGIEVVGAGVVVVTFFIVIGIPHIFDSVVLTNLSFGLLGSHIFDFSCGDIVVLVGEEEGGGEVDGDDGDS